MLKSERRILQSRKLQTQISQKTKKKNRLQYSLNKMSLQYVPRPINPKMLKMNLSGSASKLKFKDDELIQSKNSYMKVKDSHNS